MPSGPYGFEVEEGDGIQFIGCSSNMPAMVRNSHDVSFVGNTFTGQHGIISENSTVHQSDNVHRPEPRA